MLDTIRAARGSTRKITAFFADSAGNGITGLSLVVRVWRESDGFFLRQTADDWAATTDDFETDDGDDEIEELDSSDKPGYYEFAFAVPDADDTYTIRIDGSASAANRFLTAKVIADTATTELLDIFDGGMAEMAQGIPPATPTLQEAMVYIYMTWRNNSQATSSERRTLDDKDEVISKAPMTDDGTTFSQGQMVSGA